MALSEKSTISEKIERHETRIVGMILPMGIFAFLLILFIAFMFRISDNGILIGVPTTPMPDFTLSGVLDGSYQKAWGSWLNENFWGHAIVVKCHNQIEYSIFHDGNGDWGIGKDYMIYSRGNARAYAVGTMEGIAEQTVFDDYAEKVYSLQSKLEQQGKDFVYLLSPMKVEIYPEKLAWNYRILANQYVGRGMNNRDKLVAAFEKYGVKYYDLTDDIRQMRSTNDFEVFPKTGHHWTLTAVAYEMNNLFESIEHLTSYTSFPKINVVGLRDELYSTDMDIYNNENIFKGVLSERYTFPEIQYEKSDANVYIFGTSMSNVIMDALAVDEQSQAFDKLVYQSYFTYKVVADNTGKKVTVYQEGDPPEKLQIIEHIQNSDLVIMESTALAGVLDTHIKFLDYMNQNYN